MNFKTSPVFIWLLLPCRVTVCENKKTLPTDQAAPAQSGLTVRPVHTGNSQGLHLGSPSLQGGGSRCVTAPSWGAAQAWRELTCRGALAKLFQLPGPQCHHPQRGGVFVLCTPPPCPPPCEHGGKRRELGPDGEPCVNLTGAACKVSG